MLNFIDFFRLFDQGVGIVEGCVTAGAKIHVTCVRSNTSKVVKKNKDILHMVERGLAARGGGSFF